MRKINPKLVLRKETVREFSGQALSRVIGGHETSDAVPFSRDKVCLTAAAIIALDGVARDRG
jgi:hypothetical protein